MAVNSLTGILRSLRADQLKRLSYLCGQPMGGRKDQLIARLAAANKYSPRSTRSSGPVVLSIDLGLRNLAYSLLTPALSTASTSRKTGAEPKKQSGENKSPSFLATDPPAITLHSWQRLSLLETLADASSQDGDDHTSDADMSTGDFAPAALAKTANSFLQETVLQLQPLPTHILIERQRWRSNGSSAIQEWTVRVNTLEAMLHASLQTLRDVGIWKGEVASIQPGRVGQLFLDVGSPDTGDKPQGGKQAPRRKTSAETKKSKINLLGHWLGQEGTTVRPGNPEAGRMLDAYREAFEGTERGRSKRVADENKAEASPPALGKKLDDLTDSLMQGMAWVRWQENMELLRSEGGVKQLLRSK